MFRKAYEILNNILEIKGFVSLNKELIIKIFKPQPFNCTSFDYVIIIPVMCIICSESVCSVDVLHFTVL